MRTIRDCNVVVVGGCGFLGSHLVEHLIRDRGCKVLAIDNLCVGRLDFLHKDSEFHHHDITGSETHLNRALKTFGAKAVFNYAAWPYIPESFVRPLHVFDVNANGALKVINAAQESGAEGILQISSAEIYGSAMELSNGDILKGKIAETAEVLPHSTYGAAKAAVDGYCQVAWKERKTPVIALRQFNCVGERETHPYVVPEIISQLAALESLRKCLHCCNWKDYRRTECQSCKGTGKDPTFCGTVKLGNNSFRDFLYAGDQARIAVELLERGAFGEVYNLGSETGIKIYDLAVMIGKLMGFADVRVEVDEARKRPWEIWHLQSCNDKIKRAVGTKGFDEDLVDLETALRKTIRWFESNGRRWPWEK